jgi:hypothetical protein
MTEYYRELIMGNKAIIIKNPLNRQLFVTVVGKCWNDGHNKYNYITILLDNTIPINTIINTGKSTVLSDECLNLVVELLALDPDRKKVLQNVAYKAKVIADITKAIAKIQKSFKKYA